MRLFAILGLLPALLPFAPCSAAELALTPANTRIGLVTYAFGMFARPGHFTAFSGTLHFDPAHQADCHIDMTVEIASLDMGTASRTAMALGPTMLDAAHYPSYQYHGACGTQRATGQLTLHGVTHTLVLAQVRQGQEVTATGSLRRQDYGVDGMPGLIGGSIRIEFAMTLPQGVSAGFALPSGARPP